MSNKINSGVILTVECGINEGSLGLWRDGVFTGGSVASHEKKQSQSLLKKIRDFLAENFVEKRLIEKIVCGEIIGSATGNRVAAATALGLQTAWQCGIEFSSVLENALRYYAGRDERALELICLVRSGQNIYGQKLEKIQIAENFEMRFSGVVQNERIFEWVNSSRLPDKIVCLNEFPKSGEFQNEPWFTRIETADVLPSFYLGANFSGGT